MIICSTQLGVEATVADAGWYPDGQDATLLRYFDGQSWTAHTRPATDAAAATPATAQSAATPAQPQQSSAAPAGWQQPTAQQQQYYAGQQQPTQQFGQPYAAPQQQGYPAGYGAAPFPDQPAPKGKRRRKPLLLALAAVVVIAAGLVTFFALSGSDPKYTWHGKSIASSDKVLTAAEKKVDAFVTSRHGAKNSDTRCYYAQPKKARSGAKKTDVDSSLRCGPVLFVDGDAARAYLPVRLSQDGTKDGAAKLATASLTGDPTALPDDVKLGRPDGKSAPKGSGGLKVPNPPAAAADALLVAELGPTTPPKTLSGKAMGAKSTTVTLLASGEISRYGSGDSARSAPSGKKLVAFRVRYSGGDVTDSASNRATFTVSGSAPRQLPEIEDGDQWIVAAVPSSGGAALTLSADGYTQTLALPDGTPGANNLAVLARTHQTALIFKSFNLSLKVSGRGVSKKLTARCRQSPSTLSYWVTNNESQHASSVHNGLLSLNVICSQKDLGSDLALDPPLLKMRLSSGQTIGARNVAPSGRVGDVFEVPASFTRGTVYVSGSEKQSGVTLRVTKTVALPISIPAG